jgi:hypothetical protein
MSRTVTSRVFTCQLNGRWENMEAAPCVATRALTSPFHTAETADATHNPQPHAPFPPTHTQHSEPPTCVA